MISDLVRPLWTAPRPVGAAGPLRRDWALVVLVCCAGLLEGALRADVAWRGVAVGTVLLVALVLPWRRVHPLAALAATIGVSTLLGVVGRLAQVPQGEVGLYTMIFVLLLPYALFRWGSGREVAVGSVILLVADGMSIVEDHSRPSDVIGGFVVLALAALLGLSARFLSTARGRELEQVRSRERELLARELHDTVAHHVSAMVIRAQAGRVLAGSQPDAAVDALRIIEAEGSRTLAELRTMVGALRAGDDADLTPLAGLAEIQGLAGHGDELPAVTVTVSGVPDDVSPAVGAALFRIAQEGVTNARRHARHARRIEVQVTGQDGALRLTVRDDGDPVAAVRGPDGYGMIGMAERAKLLGGTLRAGPADDRGWLVEAVLPGAGRSRTTVTGVAG